MNCKPRLIRSTLLALSVTGVLSAGILVGCESHDMATESDLQLRYDAADRITNAAERDRTLASVAEDAADQGDMGVAKRALERIGSGTIRSDTAAECAVRLVKAGDRADGNQIAATFITDPGQRNATFKRLADSDPGSADPARKGIRNYLGD